MENTIIVETIELLKINSATDSLDWSRVPSCIPDPEYIVSLHFRVSGFHILDFSDNSGVIIPNTEDICGLTDQVSFDNSVNIFHY